MHTTRLDLRLFNVGDLFYSLECHAGFVFTPTTGGNTVALTTAITYAAWQVLNRNKNIVTRWGIVHFNQSRVDKS